MPIYLQVLALLATIASSWGQTVAGFLSSGQQYSVAPNGVAQASSGPSNVSFCTTPTIINANTCATLENPFARFWHLPLTPLP